MHKALMGRAAVFMAKAVAFMARVPLLLAKGTEAQ
jgi:hypothetical protein